jgi:multidrug efflux pump subunit AcrA (membrane-fusion protein)
LVARHRDEADVKHPVIGFVLAALAGASCASRPPQTANDRAAVTVAVGRVDARDVTSSLEAGGIVRARATALIAGRVMAPITRVHVNPGDHVRRGAVLVTLDAREIQANKERAEAASLSAAEAAHAAEADVRGAESTVTLARATHDRMAALQAKRSATAQELDQAVAALAAAEAQRASAQARLAAANSARDAAQASVESATVTATYAVLTAPFDGLVTERRADPGSMATPGLALLVLEDPATYRLEVQLDEARAALVQVGATVSVRLDNATGEGEEAWSSGHVAEIARVDPASHAFLVKVDLPASGSLRSGLFGRARFSGPTRRALTVPTSALINRGQLTFVYLVDAEGRARLRPISVGTGDHDRTEVLAGVREGDAIVTHPPPSLADGSPVTGEPR